MNKLADAPERLRALTDHGATLLVEAAAGTGKTALIAGRIVMLLADGVAPSAIAALSFNEFAASELGERINTYVAALLDGETPEPLALALPAGLSSDQRAALEAARVALDQLTSSTIHAFCQSLITAYAIDANVDPGARVLEGQAEDTIVDIVFDDWLERRLSPPAKPGDTILYLAEHNPRTVTRMLRKIAKLRLDHRSARAPRPAEDMRPDRDFADAVAAFRVWYNAGPAEPESALIIADLEALAGFFGQPFEGTPDFAELWRLAHPPQFDRLMAKNAKTKRDKNRNLKTPKLKGAWKKAAGAERGAARCSEFEARFAVCAETYRRLVGHIAASVMSRLSDELDGVVETYRDFKRSAALLDFDDLLHFARDLVRDNAGARESIAARFRFILVDEFQDTDPIQAELFFRIAAVEPAERWADSRLRPGALFMVGDPKQAIYAFRGADVTSYERAYAAVEASEQGAVLKISANFRSRPGVIDHVNACFAAPFSEPAQPDYVALEATLPKADHDLPAAARLTISAPDEAGADMLRDLEADAVADLCARLVGNFPLVEGRARAGDIALLAPAGTQLWRYERALAARKLPFVSQAGKSLFQRQETQDLLALVRALADRGDALAFGALMRGPLVGLTEEELLDIAFGLHAVENLPRFSMFTAPDAVVHELAASVLTTLQALSRKARTTTPFLILSEALERLNVRAVLAGRGEIEGARSWANIEAVLERARAYGVGGLRKFARDLSRAWASGDNTPEGRLDAEADTIQIVTMHSAKGLEWPIVIPINSSTQVYSPRDYVHRPDEDTLHWIIDDIRAPELAAGLDAAAESKRQENARLWYVACTRAQELLIIPKIDQADQRSYARIVPLGHDLLPEWDMDRFSAVARESPAEVANRQTKTVFEAERERIVAASAPARWVTPSSYDGDRIEAIETLAADTSDVVDVTLIAGAGRLRGLVMHKLMEEVLTGETRDEPEALGHRAAALTRQLAAQFGASSNLPDAQEMAAAVTTTLALPAIADVRPRLRPELSLYAQFGPDELLAGRADAIAYDVSGNAEVVFDWKSDVEATDATIEQHANQLAAYLAVTAAKRGALVYMSTGAIRWVNGEGS